MWLDLSTNRQGTVPACISISTLTTWLSSATFLNCYVIFQGGSWVSTGDEASRFARYAFRRHFFQHLGFRVVKSVGYSVPVRLVGTPVFVLGVGVEGKMFLTSFQHLSFETKGVDNWEMDQVTGGGIPQQVLMLVWQLIQYLEQRISLFICIFSKHLKNHMLWTFRGFQSLWDLIGVSFFFVAF